MQGRRCIHGFSFRVNRASTERFADRWTILSAKYGLIDPDFIIPEEYNVTFKQPSTNPVKVEVLEKQAAELNPAFKTY